MTGSFPKYFTLEEAAGRLPAVRQSLEKATAEITEARNSAILYKRIMETKRDSGIEPSDPEIMLLQEKFEAFEDTYNGWVLHFADQGIIMRELETGLIDFPYRSRDGQEYFLCWRLDEEGIFYFHGINEGFAGRHPISLLPD